MSVPWPPVATATDKPVFRVGGRLPDREARIALGRFGIVPITLPGGGLELAILGKLPARQRKGLRDWVTKGARSVAGVSGRFPVPRLQVLVVPIGGGREPVPWAEIQRGGGDAVHLFIDERRPIEDFQADWTLTHELSHLLHPPLGIDGRWISEGLASYYQNTLRARSGALTTKRAWEQLHAGFERGRKGTVAERNLTEASEQMVRDRAFMRVYWSGAAIALLADAELRRRSGGAQSLDTVLAALQDCCLPARRRWNNAELVARLDELSGTDVFSRLYSQHAHAKVFPDLQPLYRRLGLEVRSGKLRLREDAAEPWLRRDIMHDNR